MSPTAISLSHAHGVTQIHQTPSHHTTRGMNFVEVLQLRLRRGHEHHVLLDFVNHKWGGIESQFITIEGI